MRKIMLVGRSECGKTTLRQALKGGTLKYEKTQYINHFDVVIDTPGEYAQTTKLAHALGLYAFESQEIALLASAIEPYTLYPPCIHPIANRPMFGIVTQIDQPTANVPMAHHWLELAGCNPIFHVSSYTGEGIWQILNYLREPGDVLPWESQEEAEQARDVKSDKHGNTFE